MVIILVCFVVPDFLVAALLRQVLCGYFFVWFPCFVITNQLGFQCADVFAGRFMQKARIVIADGNAILTHITEMWNLMARRIPDARMRGRWGRLFRFRDAFAPDGQGIPVSGLLDRANV